MLKFEQYTDLTDINESMLLDSGTEICRLETDKGICTIEVRGEVSVDFRGNRYKRPSEFPDDLKTVIRRGGLWDSSACPDIEGADTIYVGMNNWFEAFWSDNPSFPDQNFDTVDVENYTASQLLDACIECLKCE